MNITFSTCWYVFKAKFDVNTYMMWIDKFLSNVENFYLVVYTDSVGIKLFGKYFDRQNIKFIIVVASLPIMQNKKEILNSMLNGICVFYTI